MIQHLNFMLKRGKYQPFWQEIFQQLQEQFSVAKEDLREDYSFSAQPSCVGSV